jgi:hypothetical protein
MTIQIRKKTWGRGEYPVLSLGDCKPWGWSSPLWALLIWPQFGWYGLGWWKARDGQAQWGQDPGWAKLPRACLMGKVTKGANLMRQRPWGKETPWVKLYGWKLRWNKNPESEIPWVCLTPCRIPGHLLVPKGQPWWRLADRHDWQTYRAVFHKAES